MLYDDARISLYSKNIFTDFKFFPFFCVVALTLLRTHAQLYNFHHMCSKCFVWKVCTNFARNRHMKIISKFKRATRIIFKANAAQIIRWSRLDEIYLFEVYDVFVCVFLCAFKNKLFYYIQIVWIDGRLFRIFACDRFDLSPETVWVSFCRSEWSDGSVAAAPAAMRNGHFLL